MLTNPPITPAARVAKGRQAALQRGLQRVEVSVPHSDARLIRQLAGVLRQGGAPARAAKTSLQKYIRPTDLKTGEDLWNFLRNSPLCGLDLVIERDMDTGRPVDIFGE